MRYSAFYLLVCVLLVCYFLKTSPVYDLYSSAGEGDETLVYEILQHSCHHFSRGLPKWLPMVSWVILRVSESSMLASLREKICKPFVKTFPHDLLYQPHNVRKPACHDFVCIVGKGCGNIHDVLIDFRRDH